MSLDAKNRLRVTEYFDLDLDREQWMCNRCGCSLGSAREISRLRLCFENVTFQSSLSPYAPADDPWQIIPTSAAAAAAIEAALANWTFVNSRFRGLFAAFHDALEAGTLNVPRALASVTDR